MCYPADFVSSSCSSFFSLPHPTVKIRANTINATIINLFFIKPPLLYYFCHSDSLHVSAVLISDFFIYVSLYRLAYFTSFFFPTSNSLYLSSPKSTLPLVSIVFITFPSLSRTYNVLVKSAVLVNRHHLVLSRYI